MILNQRKIQKLIDVIEQFNALFIGSNIDKSFLTQSDKNILTRRGVNWREFGDVNDLEYAFRFGILADALRDQEKVKTMTFKEFKKFVQSGKFLPLSDEEQMSLHIVKNQVFKDVNKLKNRMIDDLFQISINSAQELRYPKIIQKQAQKAIQGRMTVKQFSTLLHEKTKDWSRDFDRIADYVMHSAYMHGKANSLLKQYGTKVKVWYRVKPDACKHCKKCYEYSSGKPKTFLLTTVIGNGSNIGIKGNKYKPSLYPLHPWCRCEVELLPENGVWDSVKRKFVIGRNTYGVNRKSKIKITTNVSP